MEDRISAGPWLLGSVLLPLINRVTPHIGRRDGGASYPAQFDIKPLKQDHNMAKKSRGGRMTAAKNRAAKSKGGKGLVKNRPAGRRIMST